MNDMREECGKGCPEGLNVDDFTGGDDKMDEWDVWGICFTVAINKAFAPLYDLENLDLSEI